MSCQINDIYSKGEFLSVALVSFLDKINIKTGFYKVTIKEGGDWQIRYDCVANDYGFWLYGEWMDCFCAPKFREFFNFTPDPDKTYSITATKVSKGYKVRRKFL